jgi:hypothetical protein
MEGVPREDALISAGALVPLAAAFAVACSDDDEPTEAESETPTAQVRDSQSGSRGLADNRA